MVLVPRIVREGYFVNSIGQEAMEMLLLFGAGLIGLILYNWIDIRLRRMIDEKHHCAREVSDTTRDLTFSYNYIGSLNRKIEILKEIILSVPKEMYSKKKSEPTIYDPVIKAIELFGECRGVRIGFYDYKKKKKLLEVNKGVEEENPISTQDCFYADSTSLLKKDKHVIIRSPEKMQGVSVYCIIKRNSIKPEDADLIKALLVQALFLYVSTLPGGYLKKD